MIIYHVSALVICQIYITWISQKLSFFTTHFIREKSQLLSDPHDVNLTDNQCRYMINYIIFQHLWKYAKYIKNHLIIVGTTYTTLCKGLVCLWPSDNFQNIKRFYELPLCVNCSLVYICKYIVLKGLQHTASI